MLAANAAYPRFRGVRDLSGDGCGEPSAVAGAFDAAAEHGASIELMLPLEHYDSLVALADHWPGVTIVLGHAGQPLERDPEYLGGWSAALTALAGAAPNVVLKLSAIASSADPAWTVDSVRPFVLPRSRCSAPTAACAPATGRSTACTATTQPHSRLSPDRRRAVRGRRPAVLHGTADRVYRI